jgi:hypothetical protein
VVRAAARREARQQVPAERQQVREVAAEVAVLVAR